MERIFRAGRKDYYFDGTDWYSEDRKKETRFIGSFTTEYRRQVALAMLLHDPRTFEPKLVVGKCALSIADLSSIVTRETGNLELMDIKQGYQFGVTEPIEEIYKDISL